MAEGQRPAAHFRQHAFVAPESVMKAADSAAAASAFPAAADAEAAASVFC